MRDQADHDVDANERRRRRQTERELGPRARPGWVADLSGQLRAVAPDVAGDASPSPASRRVVHVDGPDASSTSPSRRVAAAGATAADVPVSVGPLYGLAPAPSLGIRRDELVDGSERRRAELRCIDALMRANRSVCG